MSIGAGEEPLMVERRSRSLGRRLSGCGFLSRSMDDLDSFLVGDDCFEGECEDFKRRSRSVSLEFRCEKDRFSGEGEDSREPACRLVLTSTVDFFLVLLKMLGIGIGNEGLFVVTEPGKTVQTVWSRYRGPARSHQNLLQITVNWEVKSVVLSDRKMFFGA